MRGQQLTILGMTMAIAVLAMTIGVALSENMQAPAQTEPPATHPAPTPDVPPAVTILNNHEVEGILGREVLSAANENMGRIIDVIVDRTGRVRAAIIDFGGFLGVGSRKIVLGALGKLEPLPFE